MPLDRTVKALLLVIVLLLGLIALRPLFVPSPAQAGPGGPGAVIPLGIDGNAVYLLDGTSGDVWIYTSDDKVYYRGRLHELGKPLAQ